MAKTNGYKSRGTALVDDEPDLLRPAASSRSRVEKEFLPDSFADRFPTKRSNEITNDVRVRRRVPLRKGILPLWTRTRWGRIAALTILLVAIAAVVTGILAVRNFFDHDSRFRIDTADSIQTMGNSQLTRDELLSVFGADLGRNIFYIPLAERRAELEQIPWVEHATVMRILPNQLRVAVHERTPVAFVRVENRNGDQIKLVDAAGVILDMPPAMMAARHFSFPVVTGINADDPLSQRAARMQLYQKFVTALDSSGEHLSANLSEVNLSDPEDVRVTVPAKSSDLLLHFGNTNFLARYRIYQSHLSEWEQQYPQLAAVDLRYDSEVVLKMAGAAGTNVNASRPAAPHTATATHAVPHAGHVAAVSHTAPHAGHAAKSAPAKHAAAKRHEHHAKKHAGRKSR
ncbi:MAG: FtsQ-type POTRA domain-containing protein [Silvibacterium sp.]